MRDWIIPNAVSTSQTQTVPFSWMKRKIRKRVSSLSAPTVCKNVSIRHLLLRGIYDRRINQGMWLSLATIILIFCFYLTGFRHLSVFSVLAVIPSLIAGVDQPVLHYSSRLVRIDFLFFVSSLLVLSLQQLAVPLVVIFFPLIFVFAMLAVYGNQSGRVGTGAMIVVSLSLSWPGSQPFWLFPVLIGFGTLWYGAFAKFWMLWWGHRILRDNLAQLFSEIASYYKVKSLVLRKNPSKEQLAAVYTQQEKVYSLINESKAYLNRFGEKGYDPELINLEKDFLFGVDLMELLQANQYRVDEIREFIQNNNLVPLYSDCSAALISVLNRKSFAVRTRQQIDMHLDTQLAAFEEALENFFEDVCINRYRSQKLLHPLSLTNSLSNHLTQAQSLQYD